MLCYKPFHGLPYVETYWNEIWIQISQLQMLWLVFFEPDATHLIHSAAGVCPIRPHQASGQYRIDFLNNICKSVWYNTST